MKYLLIIILSILLFIILLFLYSSLVLAKRSDLWIEKSKDNLTK